MTPSVRRGVALAPLTTLGLGGAAEHFAEARTGSELALHLGWARDRGLLVTVLGGGSNVVVADGTIRGLVIRVASRGVEARPDDGRVLVTAQAGEPWDELVERAVGTGLQGVECLSGIPGLVGAVPIQNVGAYGQEVSETISRVEVLDRRTLEIADMTPEQCELTYRDSVFKRHPGRHVVLSVTLALRPEGDPAIRYAELELALAGVQPTLSLVRKAVLTLRRAKSMVIDAQDPNRRSAGSFFTNPVIEDAEADRVAGRAAELGSITAPEEMPRWPVGEGRSKLSAGWLIERSGFPKGYRSGSMGISSRHALALVHHGGGTTTELLDLARRVRDGVLGRFGVRLRPEPVLVGATDELWSS